MREDVHTRCFEERFMGQMEAPSSWKIEIGDLTETGAQKRRSQATGP